MTERGFCASKQQYRRQLTKWGMSKNLKGSDWKYISRILARRAKLKKLSVVSFNGQRIEDQKVGRATRRYHLPSLLPRDSTPEPKQYISIRTPEGSIRSGRSPSRSPALPELQTVPWLNRPAVPVSVDNLPSVDFMNLLDQSLEHFTTDVDALVLHSSISTRGLMSDMQGVVDARAESFRILDTTFGSQTLWYIELSITENCPSFLISPIHSLNNYPRGRLSISSASY